MANRLIKQNCLMISSFFYVGGKFITSTSINSSLWLVSDNCTSRCCSVSCSLKMRTTFSLPCYYRGGVASVCLVLWSDSPETENLVWVLIGTLQSQKVAVQLGSSLLDEVNRFMKGVAEVVGLVHRTLRNRLNTDVVWNHWSTISTPCLHQDSYSFLQIYCFFVVIAGV